MKLSEYIAEIERPLKLGEDRANNVSDLYGHFQQGHFTPKDVLEFYRQRDSPRFIEAVKLYEQGKLFQSQMQSYHSWERHDFAKEDKATAETFLSVENSAQQHHEGIHLFIFVRIYGARPRSDDMSSKIQEKWIAENKRFGWRWNT